MTDGTADPGTVTCELLHHRAFVTIADANAHLEALFHSPAVLGRPRRGPQDAICIVETTGSEVEAVQLVRQVLPGEDELRQELKHGHDVWIDGKHPGMVTLAEARAYSGDDAIAVLGGDDGGQVYVVCPIACVACDEATLRGLLLDIDAIEWPGQPEMAYLIFYRASVGEGVWGGMGGGLVTNGIWVHESLHEKGLEPQIRAVLAGERPALDP